MKLYKVTLKGMTQNSTGIAYGISYVVARDSNEAYLKVKDFLDEKGIGFSRERELDKIELLASDYSNSNVSHLLFI